MSGPTLWAVGVTIFTTLITPIIVYNTVRPSTRVLFEGIFKFIIESVNTGISLRRKWTIEDVPDMTGKVIIVTGGNTGIGFEIAKGLLKKGAKVYIGTRNTVKAERAVKKLISLTGCRAGNIQTLPLDLADLPTVRTAVLEFLSKETRLDILYNNAGIQAPPLEWLSAQGYDLTFATNVLGPYYFTKLLLPILSRTSISYTYTSAKHASSSVARIIEVSSDGHLLNANTEGNPIDYDTLLPSPRRTSMIGSQLYYQSKSANVLVSSYRARNFGSTMDEKSLGSIRIKHEGKGKGKREVNQNQAGRVVSICVHPGHFRTNLTQYLPHREKRAAIWLGRPPAKGAVTPLYAGAAPEAANLNGKYLIADAREGLPRSDHINNVEAEDKLVAWLEEQLRIHGLV